MQSYFPFTLLNNRFLLSSNRCIFWEEQQTLLLSDLHLGKSGHFRKSGIAVPQNIFKEDLHRLLASIQFFNPSHIVIVGDLFHSDFNREHDLFLRWRNDVNRNIQLVKGNHDILKKQWYEMAGIELHEKRLTIGRFSFVHDINACEDLAGQYCFSGHIHPGIKIKGLGRQQLQLPCFYFGRDHAVLPAFGKFTGTFPVEPQTGDSVFALVENRIIQVR